MTVPYSHDAPQLVKLMWSSITNKVTPMVKVLLESGVSVQLTDHNKSSLLHYSIMAQDDTTTLLLLKNGALVNHKDRYGVSAIHLCAVFDKTGTYSSDY